MLVLSREVNQSIVIDGNIRVIVTSVKGDKVRIGIEAPPDVQVMREELLNKGKNDGRHSTTSTP